MADTDDVVSRFCAFYHPYNDISPARRTAQTRVLRELRDTVGRDELDADQLRSYLASLVTEKHLKPATIRQRMTMIRPYCEWLFQQRIITAEQFLELKATKPPRGNGNGKPRPYTRKEIQAMWERLEDVYPWSRDGKPGERIDRGEMFVRRWRNGSSSWARVQPYAVRLQVEAVIAIALYGGLRRDEILTLGIEQMHHENAYIVVASRKGADAEEKTRPVPMQPSMARAIERWLTFRDELAPPHDSPWLSLYRDAHKTKPLRPRTFRLLMAPLGMEYHRLRHTFATESLRAGMPIDKLSKIMGHARIQQTLAYAELLEGDVLKASERVSRDFERAVGRAA